MPIRDMDMYACTTSASQRVFADASTEPGRLLPAQGFGVIAGAGAQSPACCAGFFLSQAALVLSIGRQLWGQAVDSAPL